MTKEQEEDLSTFEKEVSEIGEGLREADSKADYVKAYNDYCKNKINFKQAEDIILDDRTRLSVLKNDLKSMALKLGAKDAFFLMHYFDLRDQLKDIMETYRELLRAADNKNDSWED